ncbi:hypothetical protein MMC34_004318 [Xylographa carneopallida]|nr:hypothetical protein [Xylographa carneopallida]
MEVDIEVVLVHHYLHIPVHDPHLLREDTRDRLMVCLAEPDLPSLKRGLGRLHHQLHTDNGLLHPLNKGDMSNQYGTITNDAATRQQENKVQDIRERTTIDHENAHALHRLVHLLTHRVVSPQILLVAPRLQFIWTEW